MVNGDTVFVNAALLIATTHSLFNIANTLVFYLPAPWITKQLIRFVPDKAIKEKPHLTSLDVRMLETPIIAIEQSRVEILRMADSCNKMMNWLRESLVAEQPVQTIIDEIFHREEVLDTIQDEVVDFMTEMLAASLPHRAIIEGRRQMRMADEYESISDYITSILKFQLKLQQQGVGFDEKQRAEILSLHDRVAEYMRLINVAYEQRHPEIITKATSIGGEIAHRVKDLHQRHLDALSKDRIEPRVSVAYTATLNSYRRVRDHALNIAESMAGAK
jgi:phosphate:Na+ symporter